MMHLQGSRAKTDKKRWRLASQIIAVGCPIPQTTQRHPAWSFSNGSRTVTLRKRAVRERGTTDLSASTTVPAPRWDYFQTTSGVFTRTCCQPRSTGADQLFQETAVEVKDLSAGESWAGHSCPLCFEVAEPAVQSLVCRGTPESRKALSRILWHASWLNGNHPGKLIEKRAASGIEHGIDDW